MLRRGYFELANIGEGIVDFDDKNNSEEMKLGIYIYINWASLFPKVAAFIKKITLDITL